MSTETATLAPRTPEPASQAVVRDEPHNETPGLRDELILEAGRASRHYWLDLWRFRELFYILAWRDVSVRYKQTVLGVAWALGAGSAVALGAVDLFADTGSAVYYDNFNLSVVPEPSVLALLGIGLVSVAGLRRRNSR